MTRRPVLWASGQRGHTTLNPLIAAVGADRCYTVTTPANSLIDNWIGTETLIGVLPAASKKTLLTGAATLAQNLARLRRNIKAKASLIHVVMASPLDYFYLNMVVDRDTPILLTIHDDSRHPGEESRLLEFFDVKIRNRATHYAVLSDHVFESVSRRGLRPVLARPGLVMRSEVPLPPRAAPLSRSIRLLFFGRIQAYKGIDLLLEAFKTLRVAGYDVTLTIAGSGDFSIYRHQAENLDGLTIINEWIDDNKLCHLLASHDLALLPYIEASQSGVASDCFWAALPAVATPVGGLREQFSDGRNAVISDRVDVTSFVDAIKKLISNPRFYEACSRQCADDFREIGLDAVGRTWRHIYATIADHKPAI